MKGIGGKVAVVTGAARGLGAASAARLAELGAHVVAVDVDGDGIQPVVEKLPTASVAVRGDVSSEQDVDHYMSVALERFGRVDFHHLNAGVFGSFGSLPDLEVSDFEGVLSINVTGQFLGLRAAFRQFRDQRHPGAVVMTASIASLTGSADLLPYHVSKHAVSGLIHSAAVYGGPLGVRVNGVAPGIVPTDLFADAADAVGGKNDMERRASTTPLRRAGTSSEIADVAAYLLSDESTYVTGQILSADGGASIINTVRPSGGAGAWDTDAVDRLTYPTRKGQD